MLDVVWYVSVPVALGVVLWAAITMVDLVRRLLPRLPPAVPATVLLISVWTLQVAGVALVATRFYG